jgi:hypothetical protein
MMPPVDKRLRWFDEGAPMLRLVAGRLGMGDKLPATEECYRQRDAVAAVADVLSGFAGRVTWQLWGMPPLAAGDGSSSTHGEARPWVSRSS